MLYRLLLAFTTGLVAWMLVGCATTQSESPPTERIGQRAIERYQAMIGLDFRKAYGYITPAYREKMSYDNHLKAHPPLAKYIDAKLVAVNCISSEACDVDIEYTTGPAKVGIKGAVPWKSTRVITERWVLVDGEWWYYIRR